MRQIKIIGLFLCISCGNNPTAFKQESSHSLTSAAVAGGAAPSPGDATAQHDSAPHKDPDGASSAAAAASTDGSKAASAVVLTSITITPGTPTLGDGATQQFTATGTMSDGSKKDITAQVTWSTGDGSALEASDAVNHPGLIKATKIGIATLTASSGGVIAQAQVTITSAQIVAIAVVTTSTLSAGTPATVKAIATYSDGHTAEVTSQVDWGVNGQKIKSQGAGGTPPSGGIATITGAPGNESLITIPNSGSTTITATLGGATGNTTVMVTGGLICTTRESIVKAATTTLLTWSGVSGDVSYQIVPDTLTPPVDIGKVVPGAAGSHQPVYQAPAVITSSFDVKIIATPNKAGDTSGTCSIRLLADGAIGVVDNGTTQGPVGNVFAIPAGQQVSTATLTAAWFTQTPIANIVLANFDVPNTPYQQGFPGFPSLTAWFSVRFQGQINIPSPGAYAFQLNADDGAVLYIDGQVVANDDGVHSIQTATGAPVQMTAGMHSFRLDYFQGPPIYLALQLAWKGPNDSAFSIIPAYVFSRPKAN